MIITKSVDLAGAVREYSTACSRFIEVLGYAGPSRLTSRTSTIVERIIEITILVIVDGITVVGSIARLTITGRNTSTSIMHERPIATTAVALVVYVQETRV